MVIVKDLRKSTIRAALQGMLALDEGGIRMTLSYIGTIEEQYKGRSGRESCVLLCAWTKNI